jgi:DNA-binding CsgD family transcriptional regulator
LERLAELSNRQHDLAGFWREATEVISAQVPYFWTPCWYTLDPASLLITSHFHEGLDVFPDEWLTAEYYEDDVNQIIEVVRSERGLSTLHELTGGDPTGTPRWQANIQLGGDQELIVRLCVDGEAWGALGLYREPGRPMFSEHEKDFLLAASPHLAQGARRALLFGEATDPEWPDGPGLVVVASDGALVSATDGATAWLHLLPGNGSEVPDALRSVAHQAIAHPMRPAEVRARAGNGAWVHLRAARFVGEDRVAVIVEPAHPGRIFELMMSAHALTPRERDVVRLVLEGQSTSQISSTLSVTPHTVQRHLKSVFDRMGVRSRRELMAQAFFTHYAPRFRDNETRTTAGVPMRGEPAPLPRENRTNPKVSPSIFRG